MTFHLRKKNTFIILPYPTKNVYAGFGSMAMGMEKEHIS